LSINLSIIGLSQSGRTSIFNALTKGKADLNTHIGAANIGIAKVPDIRLERLRDLFNPKKYTPAEVRYVEIGGNIKSIDGNLLNQISQSDALLAVVRAFNSDAVPHPDGSVDGLRDIEALFLEMAFSDMGVIERRLEKLASQLRGAKTTEKDRLEEEKALILRLQQALENGMSIRQLVLNEHEQSLLSGYRFLTQKPMLTIININEHEVAIASQIEAIYKEKFHGEGQNFVALCARLETELSELSDDECVEMCKDFGILQLGLNRIIKESFALLNLISFFTCGSDEVRAWPIMNGTNAQKAAGKIHTDIERGFIRAEVVYYQNMLNKKTMVEIKKAGLFRLEGKTYIVNDGDIINFLFNV